MDSTGLVEMIQREYGLHVERLTFLKRAWVAACYAVDCADTGARPARLFCKFYTDARQARSYARDIDFYLSLTHELCTRQILPVACPVRTQSGQFSVCFDGHLLILFHWIEGRTVGFDRFSDDVFSRLAMLVGTLHKSTTALDLPHPPREQFDLPFERDLYRGLSTLADTSTADTRGKRELRDLLLPRQAEIHTLVEHLKDLQARARMHGEEMVLCHTDLHGGNLILDERGTLHILDWEGAMLAPREHDLFFFAGDDRFWDLFLPRYALATGAVRLGSQMFGYYFFRRNLEDLVEWIVRILYECNGDEQDRRDLEGIAEDCIPGWPYLEPTIAEIDAQLRGREERGELSHKDRQ